MFTATGEELRLARNGYVFQNKSICIKENNTEKKDIFNACSVLVDAMITVTNNDPVIFLEVLWSVV